MTLILEKKVFQFYEIYVFLLDRVPFGDIGILYNYILSSIKWKNHNENNMWIFLGINQILSEKLISQYPTHFPILYSISIILRYIINTLDDCIHVWKEYYKRKNI